MRKYTEEELKYFDNPYKVAVIATVDEDGDIHMFNASTLMNKGEDEMMFGEFIRGKSKKLIYQNPKTGFLIMSVDQHFWTGNMDFTCRWTSISGRATWTSPILSRRARIMST